MPVPSYDLYGEPEEGAALPAVLHCESIAARSRLTDWSFVAHRHRRLHQFFWVTKGGGRVSLDGAPAGFGASSLVAIPALTVHGFAFSPGTIGWVVSVHAVPGLPAPEGPRILKIGGAADPVAFAALFARIAEEHEAARPHREALLGALAIELGVAVLRSADARPAVPETSQRRLMRRFTALIEERFREGWAVEAYADALAVTPTHLTRVCRGLAGRPASALIQERVLLEARRELAHGAARVGEIAHALGFADPAYFTRLFTAKVGMTPSAFRERAQGRAAAPPARTVPARAGRPGANLR